MTEMVLLAKYDTLRYRDRSGRIVEAQYLGLWSNGKLKIAVPTRAARGGSWVASYRAITIDQVVE